LQALSDLEEEEEEEEGASGRKEGEETWKGTKERGRGGKGAEVIIDLLCEHLAARVSSHESLYKADYDGTIHPGSYGKDSSISSSAPQCRSPMFESYKQLSSVTLYP